jgi:hypothetical protein
MDYQKIYNSLIERGKTRSKLDCYVEKHHIVPVCMNGLDTDENLVELTPEEHYVAHQLLVKIYPDNELLIYAAHMMCSGRPSNKLYGWLRRKHATAVSKMNSGKVGKRNSQFGTRWIHCGTENRKISQGESLPAGWQLGRKMKDKIDYLLKCNCCGRQFVVARKRKYCTEDCEHDATRSIRRLSGHKMSCHAIGRSRSESVKQKISAGMKNAYASGKR